VAAGMFAAQNWGDSFGKKSLVFPGIKLLLASSTQ